MYSVPLSSLKVLHSASHNIVSCQNHLQYLWKRKIPMTNPRLRWIRIFGEWGPQIFILKVHTWFCLLFRLGFIALHLQHSRVQLLISVFLSLISIDYNKTTILRVLIMSSILLYAGFPSGSAVGEAACNARATGDVGSIPRLGRYPGGENGNALQYSCLENTMDRGACWVTVHRVTESQIPLKQFGTQACTVLSNMLTWFSQ